jgi:hypothetical protein
LVGAQTASNLVSVTKRKFLQWQLIGSQLEVSAGARLLRDVDLLFFVHVTEEINQATNKGYCRQPECDPPLSVTAGCSIRVGHKLVEVKDRADGTQDTHDHGENIFQAFHFEPPARKMNMKVKEKAAYLRKMIVECYRRERGNASVRSGVTNVRLFPAART